jgi:2-oxoglutarate dehydrogenase E2 component (dihydrolipoamide succinyltransferase)
MIDIKIPSIGESISEVTLLKWTKPAGAWVERDEVIAELESEKATFEVNAEQAGVLQHLANAGDSLRIGDVVARIDETAERPAANETPAPPAVEAKPAAAPVATTASTAAPTVTSAAKGPHGKIVKQDVLTALQQPGKKAFAGVELNTRQVRREKMSNLRKTIARRLVEAKNSTAMLTTFNEVDMTAIMAIRKEYKDKFKEQHGVNLGFMSFFAKACSIALSEWPAVNASIDGDEIIFHDYADISIAVSTPRGLTVPVIRNVESLSMADIEKKVIELAGKARDSKLTTEDLQGGTFTITNGGVFGSLMSTPIINIPQSAILGMHKIQERPMAVNGQVVILPMMYIALSYDHRIIDGRESVSFLVRVKELLENPSRLLIGKDPVQSLLEL